MKATSEKKNVEFRVFYDTPACLDLRRVFLCKEMELKFLFWFFFHKNSFMFGYTEILDDREYPRVWKWYEPLRSRKDGPTEIKSSDNPDKSRIDPSNQK